VLCLSVQAVASTEKSETFTEALDHIYNLEFGSAKQMLEDWVKFHPSDLQALNYLANVIMDQEMLREGMLSSEAYTNRGAAMRKRKAPLPPGFEKELLRILANAQSVAENRLKQNSKDQEALYWAGVTHATRAEFDFALARSYMAALREGLEARKYHTQLLRQNPNSIDALLVVGVADYVMGRLPWYLKLLTSVGGIHGNRERGLEEVKRVSEEGHWARVDAKIVLVALHRREKMYPEALADLQQLVEHYPKNFLLLLEMAAIYRIQGNERAVASTYDELVGRIRKRDSGYEAMPAARIYFEAGKAHEELKEIDEALELYEEAGRQAGESADKYRADLAAADIYQHRNQTAQALNKYQVVANAAPNTEEGKAARQALQHLQATQE
jgi:tetratricopeptide (TPR) repeat protein